jgi:hypothetical protein
VSRYRRDRVHAWSAPPMYRRPGSRGSASVRRILPAGKCFLVGMGCAVGRGGGETSAAFAPGRTIRRQQLLPSLAQLSTT